MSFAPTTMSLTDLHANADMHANTRGANTKLKVLEIAISYNICYKLRSSFHKIACHTPKVLPTERKNLLIVVMDALVTRAFNLLMEMRERKVMRGEGNGELGDCIC